MTFTNKSGAELRIKAGTSKFRLRSGEAAKLPILIPPGQGIALSVLMKGKDAGGWLPLCERTVGLRPGLEHIPIAKMK